MAKCMFILGLLLATAMVQTALASDPDLTTDFNITNPNVGDFTSTTFRNVSTLSTEAAAPFTTNIPGLSGLALTLVFFSFGPQSEIDPHTHPRATEMFFVLSRFLDVGFVDTNNNLFETTVQAGDIFVFPKGMLPWQRNNGQGTATGFSALSSENSRTLLIAEALFTASKSFSMMSSMALPSLQSLLPPPPIGTMVGRNTTIWPWIGRTVLFVNRKGPLSWWCPSTSLPTSLTTRKCGRP